MSKLLITNWEQSHEENCPIQAETQPATEVHQLITVIDEVIDDWARTYSIRKQLMEGPPSTMRYIPGMGIMDVPLDMAAKLDHLCGQ